VAGVAFLTIRSDTNDKYAQPTGVFINLPDVRTAVACDGPALEGATNVVLVGADHREVSYGPRAFAETDRFITGRVPARVTRTWPMADPTSRSRSSMTEGRRPRDTPRLDSEARLKQPRRPMEGAHG
jgi:hypothetical protein